jgi:RES domain-containing protein
MAAATGRRWRVIDAVDVRRVQWAAACRIVPTRHPSVFLYDRVADAADFEALYALEAMTNDRLRDEVGAVRLVAPADRIFGPGSGPIMAAFTHLNPLGSRFSDGGYGVFYAARERVTAIAETAHHHARFLAATAEGPMHLPMRLYHVVIDARLHDLRPAGAVPPVVFDAHHYGPAQALGDALRSAGSAGVVYPSVRRRGGHCVGLFKPRGARACVHAAVLLYAWDGERFADIYEKVEA